MYNLFTKLANVWRIILFWKPSQKCRNSIRPEIFKSPYKCVCSNEWNTIMWNIERREGFSGYSAALRLKRALNRAVYRRIPCHREAGKSVRQFCANHRIRDNWLAIPCWRRQLLGRASVAAIRQSIGILYINNRRSKSEAIYHVAKCH